MFSLFGGKQQTHTDHSNPLHPTPTTTALEPESPPTQINNNTTPLCSTCSSLNLRTILHEGVPKERAIPLGNLTHILNNNNHNNQQQHDQCGFCNLLATLVRWMWRLDKHPRTDLAGITCALYAGECGLPEIVPGVSPVLRDVCHRLYIDTSTRPRDVTLAMMAAQSHLLMEIQLMEEDASKVGRTSELHGRRVGQQVDIALLKKWIHTCEKEHGDMCETAWWRGPGEVISKSVRVVDVVRMTLSPAPPKCRYVSLSYIWGGTGESYWTKQANLKRRSKAGGLDASVLPATISDAIQVVRQLGERYLWIDALCIVQDDPKDKATQISKMELIYGNATFTIFATGGTSAHDPLPGVRLGTRDPQQKIVKVQDLHLAIPLAYPLEAVASSAWDQRGWTYQEVVLSRRRIFFTPRQVSFECCKEVWSEDVVAEPTNRRWDGHPLKSSGIGKLMPIRAPARWNNDGYFEFYTRAVSKYTKRSLTVESDIVNAIAALFEGLTKGYKVAGGELGKAFRFGMPLVDLDRGLLWLPAVDAPNLRRVPGEGSGAGWPSWSWAGWRGGARYADVGVFLDIVSYQGSTFIYVSLVEKWYIVDDSGQPVALDVRRFGPPGGSKEEKEKEEITLNTYVGPKGDIDLQQLVMNTPNGCLRAGTLVFRTCSAVLEVTRANDVVGPRVDSKANYAIYSILIGIPRASTLAGRVILPSSSDSPSSYQFIVLSRGGRCDRLYDVDAFGKQYTGCMLNVMAVRMLEGEERMERVGVGVISERAWLSSNSQEKVVFLG